MGCPKNLVDSETVAGILTKNGWTLCGNPKTADIIIINTCAFIDSARKEAYKTITQISNIKSQNQKLIICGCLPQYEKSALLQKFPKVDTILGSSDFAKIVDILAAAEKPIIKINTPKFIISNEPKLFSTPKSYAYIKIADGCDNRCSYCIIPQLRGNFRSRKMECILEDVKNAVKTRRKEVILTAQDTTMYGIDIYGGKLMLASLLKKIAEIDGLRWIRLLYTHPAHFTDELISEITENEKVCKYVDIPIQHTDDFILRQMKRPSSKTIFSTIEKLRKKVPNISLRTTVMVGFPGETEKSFFKLLNDIKKLEFDWLGGFVYSQEKETGLKDNVPEKIKKERLNEIMTAQQKITFLKNKERVGKTFEVLTDGGKYGHCEFQAPEIDGRIVFSSKREAGALKKINILKVKNVYDLAA
jgi:ribosomal protein S12 methylthiotransferase